MKTALFWQLAIVVGTISTYVSAQSVENLDQRVRQLFQGTCSECHGRQLPEEKRKGNKRMFLDSETNLRSLADAGVVILGDAGASKIIDRVTTTVEEDRMPSKGDRLSPIQIDILRQWIASGGAVGSAPKIVAAPEIIKRDDLFDATLKDLTNAPAANQRYFRYLTLHNLLNAGETSSDLRAYRAAVSLTINSLSSQRRIIVPVAVGPSDVLLRLNLRDYGWSEAKWNLLADSYPYDIEPERITRPERFTRELTRCSVPVIRADWFVFTATQPPFYEQLVDLPGATQSGLPNTDAKLEHALGLDILTDIKRGQVMRVAFKKSGVSKSNRMIERHSFALDAYYWKSYDFNNDRGLGDLIKNPLGPPTTGYPRAFQHNGGEIIWSLPNGLQAYLLVKATGEVIPRGPKGIVQDPDGPEGEVINGISCMRCHFAGMKMPQKGEPDVADTHRRARDSLRRDEQEIFDALYRPAQESLNQIDADGQRFKQAALRAGLSVDDFNPSEEPIDRLYKRFKRPIYRQTLASEFDMEQGDADKRLRRYEDAGDDDINSLLSRLPGGLKRQNFISDFALLTRVFGQGTARKFKSVVFEEFRETTGKDELDSDVDNPTKRASSSLSSSRGATLFAEAEKKYQRKEFKEAATIWQDLADQGDADAQNYLGILYNRGEGVSKDPVEAAKWYRKAAVQGNPAAQNNLGWLYERGKGVSKDPVEAAKWYRKAAVQGNPAAQNNLGWLYQRGEGVSKDPVEAVKWYGKAADQGYALAQSNLGRTYYYGDGVSQDPVEAAKWYRKAADQGLSGAQTHLGLLYENGKGVSQDPVEAAKWYRKAADQGRPAAQFSLGILYENGKGVSKDPVEAAKWYRKAAEQGNVLGQNAYAWILATSNDSAVRDGQTAVTYALLATATNQEPTNFDTLAAAYAEVGDFAKAVITQEHAISLLSKENEKQDYTSRLEFYLSGKPYRELFDAK